VCATTLYVTEELCVCDNVVSDSGWRRGGGGGEEAHGCRTEKQEPYTMRSNKGKETYSSRFSTRSTRTREVKLGRPLPYFGPNRSPLGPNLGVTCAKLGPVGSKLGPTWAQVGSNMAQLGHVWTQVEFSMLNLVARTSFTEAGAKWAEIGALLAKVDPAEPMLRPRRIETVHWDDVVPICKLSNHSGESTFGSLSRANMAAPS
jgi:hypothetical protein